MQIKFVDGSQLECIGVHSQQVNYQGITRDSLIFLFNPSFDPTEVSALFTPNNVSVFSIIDDNNDEFFHEGYTLCIAYGKGIKDKVLNNYGISSAGVQSEEEIFTFVQMVQTTLEERTIQNHQEMLDMLIVDALNNNTEEEINNV